MILFILHPLTRNDYNRERTKGKSTSDDINYGHDKSIMNSFFFLGKTFLIYIAMEKKSFDVCKSQEIFQFSEMRQIEHHCQNCGPVYDKVNEI